MTRNVFAVATFVLSAMVSFADDIPLPEHPRPDFERKEWVNLNGKWQFRFDKEKKGEAEKWFDAAAEFPLSINVPFGWGAPLSGVGNEADVGWYRRELEVPKEWNGKRVFLVVGACEWKTQVWLNGRLVGNHRGGYTPFEFDLTPFLKEGKQNLVLRADDTEFPFRLNGKQGYGNVRGIWQTVYMEARPETYIDYIHFTPDIDKGKVDVRAVLSGPAKNPLVFALAFKKEDRKGPEFTTFAVGESEKRFTVALKDVKLWDLDNPYLYEVKAMLSGPTGKDEVSTYFGMRKIGVAKLPGTKFPYITLNNRPHYMRLTLDQSYNEGGYYTFPSDDFMKNEILISKNLGLSGNRVHIKVEVPRKLYWADKLGLLIMADVPNAWGEPTDEMFAESEYALRGMVKRDMNHPSIFSWVLYNETWGLFTKVADKGPRGGRKYLPATQDRVAAMYRLAKTLDPSRIVEDQSACNNDHVVSDINTWHAYRPAYQWESTIAEYDEKTFPGSPFNYIDGYKQTDIPMLNSECGNVWGYDGSTGDVDFSWDYHAMMNAFWGHPKCAGWLYTEHHDVCNEWNGYVRFDRSPKFDGMDELLPGMTFRDLHSDAVIALDSEICRTFAPGAKYAVPLTLWLQTDIFAGKTLIMDVLLRYWGEDGKLVEQELPRRELAAKAWQYEKMNNIEVELPKTRATGVIGFVLRDGLTPIARNFTCFVTAGGRSERAEKSDKTFIVRKSPDDFAKAEWSEKQWNVLNGKKVNGAGKGFFEYEFDWARDFAGAKVAFSAEISSKRLNGKDRENEKSAADLDYMRGKGLHDRSKNANSYPMTSTDKFKGAVRVVANGEVLGTFDLPDDPADHRGILSWHSQPRDRHLHEAGSYGYMIEANLTPQAIAKANSTGKIAIRLESDGNGLAIYGENFGRFPTDLVIKATK